MTEKWVARIGRQDFDLLLSLWTQSTVEVLEQDDSIWVRGDLRPAPTEDRGAAPSARSTSHLRSSSHVDTVPLNATASLRNTLPGEEVFRVDDGGTLYRPGERIPCGRMPEGEWSPLRARVHLRLPWQQCQEEPTLGSKWDSVMSGKAEATVKTPADQDAGQGKQYAQGARPSLRLERSTRESPPRLLLVAMSTLQQYAESAPAWRLESLAMAGRREGRCLLRGEPLPPLPGLWWTERSGICVPCGWHWWPAVDETVLRRALRLTEGEWALLVPRELAASTDTLPQASWNSASRTDCFVWRVLAGDWVRANRAAIRATAEAWRGTSISGRP